MVFAEYNMKDTFVTIKEPIPLQSMCTVSGRLLLSIS